MPTDPERLSLLRAIAPSPKSVVMEDGVLREITTTTFREDLVGHPLWATVRRAEIPLGYVSPVLTSLEELVLPAADILKMPRELENLASMPLPSLRVLGLGQLRKSRVLDAATALFFEELPEGPLWSQLRELQIGICPYQQFHYGFIFGKKDWVTQLQDRRFPVPTVQIVDVFALLKQRPRTWIRHDGTGLHTDVELLYDAYRETNGELDIAPFTKRLDPSRLSRLAFRPLGPIEHDEDLASLVALTKRFVGIDRLELPARPGRAKPATPERELEIAKFARGLGERAFDHEVHLQRMTTLATMRSDAAASAYAHHLAEGVMMHSARHSWWTYAKRSPEILELAGVVQGWPADASTAPFRKYVLLEAAHAALDRLDYDATQRFHERAESLACEPAVLGRPNWAAKWHFPKEGSPEREHFIDALSGCADQARAALGDRARRARERGEPLRGLTNIELQQLLGRSIRKRLLDDPATGHVWALDASNEFLFFDGYGAGEPPFRYDGRAKDDRAYLHDAHCDDRVSLWKGKMSYHLVHRYGAAVRWNPGEIMRDTHTLMDTHWFACADAAQAAEVVKTIERAVRPPCQRESPWRLKKGGVIMREYSTSWARVGVHGKRWVTGIMEVKPLQEFASPEEAIREFERVELEKLRQGVTLQSIRVETKWEDGTLLRASE